MKGGEKMNFNSRDPTWTNRSKAIVQNVILIFMEVSIMRAIKRGGYSPQVANNYVDPSKPVYSLSVELTEKFAYDEQNKRTDEIIGHSAWFTQEGLPPFEVKFIEEIKLPKYLSIVEFDNLMAVEVSYNVYFKADSINEVK